MSQKFYASRTDTFTFPSGAIGHRTGPNCPLGPYAKVSNCRVQGLGKRFTCYATGYADTMFSVPACTRIGNEYIGGFFMTAFDDIEFVVYDRYRKRAGLPVYETVKQGDVWKLTLDGEPITSPNFPTECIAVQWLRELHGFLPIMSSEKAHSCNEGQMP